ncbi:hypothetical protein [Pinibacter soli]|uniref:Type IX secretion system membrane protein PorP/SprF n=1 Tax=Pinibacter soli TaxID=3044211 RepID=A0ABT6RC38_9BACT|nr:hypothetical protein [Pinibacter soli]MDI3320026.1 hypothetical protein [Pinibacter soli]
MKIFFLQILTSCLFVSISFAQIVRSPLSNHYTGAVTYSKSFADVFSFSGNQAALGNLKNGSAGLYGEKRFNLKALSNYHGVIGVPLRNAGVGLNMYYSGGEDFNETQAGLAYGMLLSNNVSIGTQINFNQVRISGYGSACTVNFELGALFALSDKVIMGLHVYNPAGGKFGKNKHEKFASIYKAGVGYEASDKFFVSAEIAKEENLPVNVNAAMQYNFNKHFLARGGVSSATANYFVGVGILWSAMRLDIISSYHQQLGFSPSLMMVFNFSETATK